MTTTNYKQTEMIGLPPKTSTEPTRAKKLRDLLRESDGFTRFDDADALTTLIGFVNATGKAEEIAHDLINTFGSLKAVLEARPEMLESVAGVGPKMASLISIVVPFVQIWNRCAMETPEIISNSRQAEKYALSLLAGLRRERFYCISLNAKCGILGAKKISDGSLSEVSAYPRLITEAALNYNAHSILLCHNHPGGTCAPSMEDITATIQIQKILNGLGIMVLDHIIVANESTYSMIQHGDIDYRMRK